MAEAPADRTRQIPTTAGPPAATGHPPRRITEEAALDALLRWGTELLAACGVDAPRVDAELTAAHVLGLSRGQLAAKAVAGHVLDPGQSADFRRLVTARSTRVPLQHLTGTAAFRSLELRVGPGVFVPRPETESVAGAGIEALARAVLERGAGAVIGVDLCTGSGAIAAAMAEEVPGVELHAVEADRQAAAWAAVNLGPRGVHVHLDDAATALSALNGRVDVVVSNPPYVPDGRIPDQAEARRDPKVALYGGGADGMAVPAAVAATAARLLRSGGVFVMEHDDTQSAAVARLLAAGGLFTAVRTHRDLNDRPRYTRAVRTEVPRDEAGTGTADGTMAP